MRVATSTAAVATAGLVVCAAAMGRAYVRYCCEAPRMIGNSLSATRHVRCREARHLVKAMLGGSKACYPNGHAARVNCYVDGFRCRSWYHPEFNTSTGRCTKGRRLVIGYAGP